ncbi:2-oxoglutarate (2OG) and Fe(II)-dependent oxygenase superfamily protein [Heracleum sosnowskyi]|uniref:2-oxoglutarate (2OG) and Fe(II)-dependent oxygenase superfamily protein n=1 Tax=Heracleum sosnowskyi TaxID=360622 RepID=A0AAD8M5J7_9APIA|nr:2-oxoglutarate (2OG) and Fe(II)-dependent oxygenase superfamily protein [Heracleum sosnowskyi]
MQKQHTLKLGQQQDPPARRDATKMPKNSQSGYKSKLKLKSARKPLREVVNGVRIKPSATLNQPTLNKNNNTENKNQNEEERQGDESLDRLVLVHSDLSSLLRQIDDLVGKAIRHKATSKNDMKEIELFAHVLSEMQNSLKPWVPRFQQSISSSSLESNSQLEKSLTSKTVDIAADVDKSKVVGSPAQSNWDLLVSPSPLVSWRAGCTDEVGRQLFLLTPLPKGAISKLRGPSKPSVETSRNNTNTNVGRAPPPPFVLSENLKNDLVDCVVAYPTPDQVPDCSVTSTETTIKGKFKSPEKLSKIVCSEVAMTPCREVSPPKSCILLEPISEFTQKKVRGVRASTPFPSGLHKFSDSDEDSDYSSDEASERLNSKYPELVGIKLAHEFGNGRKIVEASPVWCMSPPKTCIVMEPPEDKMLNTTASVQFQTTACSPCGKTKKESEGLGGDLAATEFTPLWKEPGTTVCTGKRPGENTLKKELWTKFEAATTSGHNLLDLLEEVSSGEETAAAAQTY